MKLATIIALAPPFTLAAGTPAATEYLPRIDVYGGRGLNRHDVFGAPVSRLMIDGAGLPRLDVFGGGDNE